MKCLRIAVIAAAAAIAGPAFANQGDTVTVGSVGGPPPSGGLNQLTATFLDQESGKTFSFFLEARQDSTEPNAGLATFALEGPKLHGCTLKRSQTQPQPQLNPSATPFAYGGSLPFENSKCGTVNDQSVSIRNCVATIQAHGFIHSDAPNVTYLGAATIEVRYQMKRTPAKDEIEVRLHTPKKTIKLSGKATVTDGVAMMPSCR